MAKKEDNLQKGRRFRSGDEATKTAAQRGGMKSGETRRRRKAARKIVNEVLGDSMPRSEEASKILERYGLADDESMLSVIVYGLAFQAARGNVKAAQLIFQLSEDDSEGKRAAERLKLERERVALLRQDINRKAGLIDDGDLPIIIVDRREAEEQHNGGGA